LTGIINGDFESGNIAPWNVSCSSTSQSIRIVQSPVHSGKYSCCMAGPVNVSSGYTCGFQQDLSFPLPAEFIAYFNLSRPPSATCMHPYNQFTLFDSSLGNALEFGLFYDSGLSAISTFFYYRGAGTYINTNLQKGAWNKYTVRIWNDHSILLVNDVEKATFDSTRNFKWNSITNLQVLASCDGLWYLDDLSLNPLNAPPVPPTPPSNKTITLNLSPDQVTSLKSQLV